MTAQLPSTCNQQTGIQKTEKCDSSGEMTVDLQDIYAKVNSVTAELTCFAAKLHQTESDNAKLYKALHKLQSEHDTLRSDHNHLETEHNKLKSDHSKLETEHNKLKFDHNKLETEHNKLTSDHGKLETEDNKLKSDHCKLETEHNKLETKHKRLETKLSSLSVYLEAFQADHAKLTSNHGNLESEISTIQKKQHDLQAQVDQIQADEISQVDQTTEQAKERGVMEEKMDQVAAQHGDPVSEAENLCVESHLQQLHTLRRELNDLKSEFANFQASQAQFLTDYIQLQKKENNIETEFKDLQTHQTRLLCDYSHLQREREAWKSQLDTVQSKFEQLGDVKADVVTLQGKLQIEIESLQKDQGRLQTGIECLQKDQDRLHTEIESKLKTETWSLRVDKANKIGLLNTDLVQAVTELQHMLKENGSALTVLEQRLSRINSPVAFHAEVTKPVTFPQHIVRVLVPDWTRTNVGGAYNPQTGKFKAPVSGIYCVTASGRLDGVDRDKVVRMNVTVQGEVMSTAFSDVRLRSAAAATIHCVLHVKAGETVFVVTWCVQGFTLVPNLTSFSGFLVHPLL